MAAGAQALHAHLLQRRDRGVRVAGYGAPSKACILLGVASIGPELLPYTVDLSPDKIGRRIPGCGVPILPLSKISEDRPDEVLILCWDLASEVVRDGPAVRDWGGTFWVPLPELRPYVG